MKTKHTKGKWLLESSGDRSSYEMAYSIETNDNSTQIALVGILDDAKLIAAAPIMLDALISISNFISAMGVVSSSMALIKKDADNAIKKVML